MKILETDQGWVLEHLGRSPIAIEGEKYFPDKTVLTEAVKKRGMYIWSDGSVEKAPEARVKPIEVSKTQAQLDEEWEAAAPVTASSGAPPSQDPPTDPNAQPDDPDPNPVSPEPVTPKKRKSMTKKVAEDAPAKKPRAKKTASPAEPAKRGRPRKFSEEEAKERRREQARSYSANRTEEQKAAARERAKRWRENNPDKVKQARSKSIESRADRYANDPEYRNKFNEYQREYKRGQRSKD